MDKITLALQKIDSILKNANFSQHTLKKSTLLWHSGLFAPGSVENSSIWCESNPSERKKYCGSAIASASDKNETRKPYMIQFQLRKDILVLNCEGFSFRSFAINDCESSHNMMKDIMEHWCLSNRLEGLFAINGSLSEVLVVRPNDLLDIKSSKELTARI